MKAFVKSLIASKDLFSPCDWDVFERWADVDGFACYFVSTLGRVICRVPGQKAYTVTPQIDKDGYHYVMLQRGGKGYARFVSRLVATVFIPNPLHKPEVNHKDGTRKWDNGASRQS